MVRGHLTNKLTFFDDRSETIDDCNCQYDGNQKEYIEHDECSYEAGMLFFFAISMAIARQLAGNRLKR